MKTLIFNGSPRTNGDTKALIDAYKIGANGDIMQVDTFYAAISPCNDCRSCRRNPGCRIDDAMTEIYGYTRECDVVVLATPVYYGTLAPGILSVFSRYQCWYSNKRFLGIPVEAKPKKGVILLAAGGEGGYSAGLLTMKTLLRSIGVKGDIEVAASGNTDMLPASDDAVALGEAEQLARRIYAPGQ